MDAQEIRDRVRQSLDRLTTWPTGVSPEQRMAAAEQATQMFGGFSPGNIGGGVLGTLIGRQGATRAEQAALLRAEELERRGVTDREVWQQTQWTRTPRQGESLGPWVREVDDTALRIEPLRQAKLETGPLDRGLSHPELLRRIPELKDTQLTRQYGGWGGSFEAPGGVQAGRMGIEGMRDLPEARATAAHELQHATAYAHGLPQGSSPDLVREVAKNAVDRIKAGNASHVYPAAEYWHRISQGLSQKAARRGLNKEQLALAQRLGRDGTNDLVNESNEAMLRWRDLYNNPQDAYQRSLGEGLARLNERRLPLSAQERAARYPWDDLDLPAEKFIDYDNLDPYTLLRGVK